MALPFLLAGPIARRLEARQFSVWVATSAPCVVHLAMWPGPVNAGTSSTGTFEPGGEVARGARRTLRIGDKLHIAVVTATTVGNQPLLPGTRYSYNVVFVPDTGTASDLRSNTLLVDRPEQPALGYQAGLLPSVATCPATIDDLVMVHGSCNRIEAAGGPNLMFAIDVLIRDSLDEPRRRPHQLWLTGDQVYADEIPALLSPRLTTLGRELIGADELIPLPVAAGQTARVPVSQANFPAGYRKKLLNRVGNVTSAEAASHLLGVSERMAMQLHLWSPEVWARENGAVKLPDVPSVLPTKEPPLPATLTGVSPPDRAAAARPFLVANLETYDKHGFAKARRSTADEGEPVVAYAAQVGLIRRALANVPTYFVFDDHDVTDDWNLCRLWQQRVLGSGVGRSVMRDGLVAYAFLQGWGNDPATWDDGPNKQLLEAAERMFPGGRAGPFEDATQELDHLLGFDGTAPQVRWDYIVDGATHRVVACDTRTRRGFAGPVSPPVQLPDGERQRQIPEGPLPAGFELLAVVLSQPALDPILLGELTQGLIANGAAAFASIDDKVNLEKGPARALTGLETLDYEGWGARPRELARLLDRLATYPRVLIMSGDVHFAVTLGLSYWRHNQGLVSTIGQFTSSAVQYITFPEWLLPVLGQTWANELAGRGYPYDLLVWDDPVDQPLTVPGLASRGLRRRLRRRPVLLPVLGWPDGTAETVPPDAAWRLQLLDDKRPDAQRPEPVRAEALPAEFDAADPLRGANGYSSLARRHTEGVRRHANTRRIAIYNKVARLTFRHDGDRLVARSELFAIDHLHASAAPPEPFTVHELAYDEDRTTPEPRIGA